jgi:hypothetical protein
MQRNAVFPKRVVMAMAGMVALSVAFLCLSLVVNHAAHGAEVTPATAPAGGEVWAATGLNGGGPDLVAIGRAAGRKAKEACKDRKPDLVLYFDFGWASKDDEGKKAILDGVAESFDRKQIYGCAIHGGGYSRDLSIGYVCVLALGGVKTTCVKVAATERGKEEDSYATLANSLKAAYTEAAGKGRLILLMGSCSPAANGQKIVDAFTNVLGKDVPIFGTVTAAVPGWDKKNFNWRTQYFQGDMLRETVVAILITGDFTCDFAMAEASPIPKDANAQDPDEVVKSASKAAATALGEKKDNVALMLVESCFTRGHSLQKAGKDTNEVKALCRDVQSPFLLVWNEGEIGHPASGEPPVAKTNQIGVCVIRRADPAGK